MRFRTIAIAVVVLAALLLLVTGPGVRLGWWSFRSGFQLLRWAVYLGIVGAVLSAAALAITRPPRGGAAALVAALAVALVVIFIPWRWRERARMVPAIHDITTDTDDPPAFVAVLPLRARAANPATYGGPEVAAAQRRAYPDIRPLVLATPPEAAFRRALQAARDMGWTIVATDSAAGRIEATATTPWFGFRDDVVVRIRPEGTGSRVDVRSVSRVGKSDIGTNARRIRAYLTRVSAAG